MRTSFRSLFLLPLLTAPTAAQSLLALSSDNRLVPLRTTTPLSAGPSILLTGLQPAETMLAIDFRPANGRLYGFSDQGRLYTIAAGSGVATAVGAPIPLPAGSEFGFDFNPTIDRIRLVSDAGANLVLNPDTGAVQATQGTLAFAVGDVNAGATPAIAAAAYTNNVATATTTVLYNLDAARDVLTTQIPPASGAQNTVGSLGRDVTAVAGFDIAANGVAYAALNTAGSTLGTTQLFTVDLATGATTWLGTVPNSNPTARLRGLTAVPPSPDAELVVLTSDGRLARFDAASPWQVPTVATVHGLAANDALRAIDFRPATGQLYAISALGQLYVVEPQSGLATAVGSGLGAALQGSQFGFDFNPTIDRIRLVSDAGINLVLNPDTGGVQATQTPLQFAATDVNAGTIPQVFASAYTNNLAGAATTVLYGIDATNDVLVSQIPPGAGVLNTIGSGLGVDVGTVGGFDIGTDSVAYVAVENGGSSRLYRLDLQQGQSTLVSDLSAALGASVAGLAVRPPAGLSAFGTATLGCGGPVWLGAAGTPFAGSTQFTLVAHNAPTNTLGFFVLAADRLTMPMNFGGLLAWIDVGMHVATVLRPHDARGTGTLVMPLSGAWFGLATYWQWVGLDSCGPMGLSTSAALQVVVQ
jgi:hypothetical protein